MDRFATGCKRGRWVGKAAVLAAGMILLAAGAAARAQPVGDPDVQTIQGTILSFTTAPRGEADGAVLDDGTVIHWPPHLEERFTGIIAKGDRVRVTGRRETGPEGDTHLEVQTLTNLRTKASRQNDGPPPPPPRRGRGPRGPRPDIERHAAADKTVEGAIRRFTTAPRGEVDGAVLDDGTVIHWPPHLEDRFTGIVKEGDRVRVTGWMESGPAGDTHLEVQTLTNVRTKISRDNDGTPPPPPDRRRAASDRSGNREQRLRDLENQLEQIRRKIERLRRER